MIDFGFDHIHQIFVKLFAKNMMGVSEKSENLYVGQLAHAEKKIENSIFLRGPFMGQISAKYF